MNCAGHNNEGKSYHKIIVEGGKQHSQCLKENCKAMYSKCIRVAAVNKFLEEDEYKREAEKQHHPGLSICYPLA
jgi:hypothetical protein